MNQTKAKQIFVTAVTDTPDLKTNQLLQLSYILRTYDAVSETVEGSNYYFAVPTLSLDSQKQTGFSVDTLQRLSKGKSFSDLFDEIAAAFKDAAFICHDSSFVFSLLKREYARNVAVFHPSTIFGMMQAFKPVLKITSGAF